MNISIFGKGNMGQAIGKNLEMAGNQVKYLGHETDAELGDIVVLAVPYSAIDGILKNYENALKNKIVVDITNPVDFDTFDRLLVPSDSSVAAEVQKKLPESQVIKAFNTNFAATLNTGKVNGESQTTVFMASDFDEAKNKLADALKGSPLAVIDAGSLKRAREMEAFGFFQMTLAAREKITWTGGFSVVK